MSYFLMQCFHLEGMDSARDTHRPAHRDWVQSGGEGKAIVLVGSAMLDAAGGASGNFGILEAASEADARAFAEGDPYNRAGIVSRIALTPLPDTFQAHRIGEPMTPRK